MAEFDPVPPPLDLPAVPAVLSPNIPLNPPMVGEASPFIHVNGENRDLVLESIRAWVRFTLLPWTTTWQNQLTGWEGATEDQLNTWLEEATDYVTANAISGYSWRTTATPIAGSGTTNVVITDIDAGRPLVVGDLVVDEAADSNYGNITVVIDATHATVSYLGSLRGLPGPNSIPTDTAVAALITTSGTATKTALDADYETIAAAAATYETITGAAATYETITAAAATYTRKAVNQINVKDYGLLGNGSVENTTALYAAINAAPGSIDVYFPACTSYYNLQSPLPAKSAVTYRGANGAASVWGGNCEVRVTSGNLMSLTGLVYDVKFEDLFLSTYGNHLFELGAAGYAAYWKFTDCALVSAATGASLFHGSGACGYQQVVMKNCDLRRLGTATVPAFDIHTNAGTINDNSWEDCMASSANAGSTFFWDMSQISNGSSMYDNTWINLVGEQNPSGLIKVGSPLGLTLLNVQDWDTTAARTASLVQVNTTDLMPANLSFENVGNRGGTMGSFYHIDITAQARGVFYESIGDITGAAKIHSPALNGNGTRRDPWGGSSVLLANNANTPLDDTFGTLVLVGGGFTATLPDPTLTYPGRRFTIKNTASAAATVVSAGTTKTIDGAASQSLAQWAHGTYMSDGAQWLSV